MAGKLFVISAPSGAGKTTVVNEALKRLQGDVEISRHTTYTTRAPRDGEANGSHYHFVEKPEFKEKMQENFFLETTEYAGKLYGSPDTVRQQLELGKSLVIVCDRPGAHSIKKVVPDCTTVWISTPDFKTLSKRIKARGTETETQIERRLHMAQQELDEEAKQPFFKYHLVNDDFDRAVAELVLLMRNELEG